MSTYSLPTGDFVTSTLNGAITSSASTATIGTGLTIPASNGVLTIDYDSTLGLGVTSGPETISYSSYTSGTGALTGIVRGLAGTTGVAHSNGASVQSAMSTLHLNTVTANTLAITNAVAGWVLVSDTWTYASASTITVPTDATTTYQKGDKIRFKQGGSYKYGVIVVVAATLVTILVNTDYTVANSAITDVYYSRAVNPLGFPVSFTVTAFATTGWGTPTYSTGQISLQPGVGHLEFSVTGTSNSTSTTFTSPVTLANAQRRLIRCTDNGGTPVPATIDWSAGGTAMTVYATISSATWTASGTKLVEGALDFIW